MNHQRSARSTTVTLFLSALILAATLLSCRVYPNEPGRTTPFTFVQLCDPQLGFSGYEQDKGSLKQAVKQINALKPDLVIICGDMVNTANDRSYSDFKAIIAELTMPCYCVPGNHDIGYNPTPQSLQTYRTTLGPDYFVKEHKNTTFLFINTQLIKGTVPGEFEKQEAWLKASLTTASDQGHMIFIAGHYPLFCQSADEPDEYMNLPVEKRAQLLNLFTQHQVAAYLAGHTHKLILNQYQSIQLVNGETTSKNFDNRPLGFRLWHVHDSESPRHEFVPLETASP